MPVFRVHSWNLPNGALLAHSLHSMNLCYVPHFFFQIHTEPVPRLRRTSHLRKLGLAILSIPPPSRLSRPPPQSSMSFWAHGGFQKSTCGFENNHRMHATQTIIFGNDTQACKHISALYEHGRKHISKNAHTRIQPQPYTLTKRNTWRTNGPSTVLQNQTNLSSKKNSKQWFEAFYNILKVYNVYDVL